MILAKKISHLVVVLNQIYSVKYTIIRKRIRKRRIMETKSNFSNAKLFNTLKCFVANSLTSAIANKVY